MVWPAWGGRTRTAALQPESVNSGEVPVSCEQGPKAHMMWLPSVRESGSALSWNQTLDMQWSRAHEKQESLYKEFRL